MKHLLQHFKTLTKHPQNAEEIKGLILQLAVRGNLTENWRKENPNVEPTLNKLIEIEKEKGLSKIEKDEIPFELNTSWDWCRFIDVARLRHGHQFRKYDFVEEGIPVIKIGQCKSDGTLDFSKCNYIDISRKHEFENDLIFQGHLLMALTGGTLGKVTRVDKDYGILVQNYRVGNFFANEKILSLDFLNVILESDLFQGLVRERINQNAQPNIGKDNIEKIVMPIPPLEEQKAIVAIVNELFREVEQLENLTKTRIQLKEDFVTSALKRLTETNKVNQEWKYLQTHFTVFFTEKENVKQLRDTILQLAVQGKLTTKWRSQNPNTEPASELLKRIQTEKKALIAQKKIKKEKPLPPIEDHEKPYNLPESWVWCRLGNYTHYGALTKCENKDAKESTWVLELEDVEKESSKLLKKVRIASRDFKSTKSAFKTSDVIYGKLRPYLDKVIVADEDGVCTTEMIPIKSFDNCSPDYLRWYMKNPDFIEYANSSTHGMRMPRMGTDVAKNSIISVPPLEEQNAIVKQVNSLMALCDSLEEHIDNSQTQIEQLMQSCLRAVFENN